MSDNPALAHLALRVGLAFAFLYPPISALFDPLSWEGYFPGFVHALPVPTIILLHAFGVLEVVLALWVLSGRKIRLPAAAMALLLLGIVAFNLSQLDVLFRDLALSSIALALAVWPTPHSNASILRE